MPFKRYKHSAKLSIMETNECISLNSSIDTDDRRRMNFRSSGDMHKRDEP
jgi:hypothetical protein